MKLLEEGVRAAYRHPDEFARFCHGLSVERSEIAGRATAAGHNHDLYLLTVGKRSFGIRATGQTPVRGHRRRTPDGLHCRGRRSRR